MSAVKQGFCYKEVCEDTLSCIWGRERHNSMSPQTEPFPLKAKTFSAASWKLKENWANPWREIMRHVELFEGYRYNQVDWNPQISPKVWDKLVPFHTLTYAVKVPFSRALNQSTAPAELLQTVVLLGSPSVNVCSYMSVRQGGAGKEQGI